MFYDQQLSPSYHFGVLKKDVQWLVFIKNVFLIEAASSNAWEIQILSIILEFLHIKCKQERRLLMHHMITLLMQKAQLCRFGKWHANDNKNACWMIEINFLGTYFVLNKSFLRHFAYESDWYCWLCMAMPLQWRMPGCLGICCTF